MIHVLAATPTDWGPVLFATLAPMGLLTLGGLVHVVFRLGKVDSKVDRVVRDVDRLEDYVYPSGNGWRAGGSFVPASNLPTPPG